MELMTGVYTDNQPDFTWLKPFEEKTFKQYFMPYKAVEQVKNATTEAVAHLSLTDSVIKISVYATSVFENANIVLTRSGEKLLDVNTKVSPADIYETEMKVENAAGNDTRELKEEELHLFVYSEGRCLVEYQPEPEKIPRLPEPAKETKKPEEIQTCEELYLTGQHIEQYRHATYLPDPYYLEGLKRDSGDIRLNNAYGLLLMRRGQFVEAEKYFRKALERLMERNPNPYNSESCYLLGMTLFYQERYQEAYDAFYKATWSNEQQEMSFYYLAAIDTRAGRYTKALEHIEKALVKNSHNIKARGLKAWLLKKIGKTQQALDWIRENLQLDAFDFVSENELVKLNVKDTSLRKRLNNKMRDFQENYLMAARDYAEWGAYKEALALLDECTKEYPMLYYYKAYYQKQSEQSEGNPRQSILSETVRNYLNDAEECVSAYCFPNKLEESAIR